MAVADVALLHHELGLDLRRAGDLAETTLRDTELDAP